MSNRTLLEEQLDSSEGQLEKLLLEGKESVSSFTEKYLYTCNKNYEPILENFPNCRRLQYCYLNATGI